MQSKMEAVTKRKWRLSRRVWLQPRDGRTDMRGLYFLLKSKYFLSFKRIICKGLADCAPLNEKY